MSLKQLRSIQFFIFLCASFFTEWPCYLNSVQLEYRVIWEFPEFWTVLFETPCNPIPCHSKDIYTWHSIEGKRNELQCTTNSAKKNRPNNVSTRWHRITDLGPKGRMDNVEMLEVLLVSVKKKPRYHICKREICLKLVVESQTREWH